VVFVVREAGQRVRLKADSLRVEVTRDLPDRVDTLLQTAGACFLEGPEPIRKKPAGPLKTSDGPTMGFSSARQGEEVCASVDRY
jgi:hypothetical protein